MPFYGAAIVCTDDPGVRAILPMHLSARWSATAWRRRRGARRATCRRCPAGSMRFTVQQRGGAMPDLPVTLNLAGEHNVRNALAAIAVATELELPDAPVAGAGRVCRRGPPLPAPWRLPAATAASFTLIDDYGHHPVEMAAVLAAARGAFPGRRLVLAFQPHRYTRTRDCFEDFVKP
jgi:UDP-N-acetylmuramate--alanine ligase